MQNQQTKGFPQGPWYNPELAEGVYDATITEVTEGTYGKDRNTYNQFVFWLPNEQVHVVTNFYLPATKQNNKTGLRLMRLCQVVSRIVEDVWTSPHSFKGDELRITVKRMRGKHGSQDQSFCDVDRFLPAEI